MWVRGVDLFLAAAVGQSSALWWKYRFSDYYHTVGSFYTKVDIWYYR